MSLLRDLLVALIKCSVGWIGWIFFPAYASQINQGSQQVVIGMRKFFKTEDTLEKSWILFKKKKKKTVFSMDPSCLLPLTEALTTLCQNIFQECLILNRLGRCSVLLWNTLQVCLLSIIKDLHITILPVSLKPGLSSIIQPSACTHITWLSLCWLVGIGT